ncbi:glycerate kinase [Granulosicoccaceae sp. 1_MG-2023]|nr:glycerate kinase [Granulosicoccaceae sp. 1_MG-2023]
MNDDDARAFLESLFRTAVAASQPAGRLKAFLPPPPAGRTIVIGAGKGAASMARAFEDVWPEPVEGLVVTRYGHATDCTHIEVIEASHPVPDEAGRLAATRIMSLTENLSADDLVVCLISGGASALLSLPCEGVSAEDKRALNKALLKSGATITEMNSVRKHLSAIKGGRLAAHCAPARLLTLLISDVPGDDPDVIGSGPTVPDSSTLQDAIGVLDKYAISEPAAAVAYLREQAAETPKPGDAVFDGNSVHLIATPQMALDAAAEAARAAGITPLVLSDRIEGESRDIALMHAAIATQIRRVGQPLPAPCVILSGGETTVTVKGGGRGGRNAEFLLALTLALQGADGIHAIACDTDGIDGTEDNAGALAGPDSLQRAAAAGLNARAMLEDNDGYSFFDGLGDLLKTGPTLTNVNDFRAILVLPATAN